MAVMTLQCKNFVLLHPLGYHDLLRLNMGAEASRIGGRKNGWKNCKGAAGVQRALLSRKIVFTQK